MYFRSKIIFLSLFICALTFSGCKDEPVNKGDDCSSENVVVDVDNNVYKVVKIGRQCWMAENLRVSRFNQTHIIPFSVNSWWPNTQYQPAAGNYNNDSTDLANYGKLYNWYTMIDPRGLCPKGWHVPSDAEWQELIDYLGGPAVAGGKLKDTLTWNSPNTGGTNSSGFNGRPGGYRSYGTSSFYRMGNEGYYWTKTESDGFAAYYYALYYDSDSIVRKGPFEQKGIGRSCRCVKDTI